MVTETKQRKYNPPLAGSHPMVPKKILFPNKLWVDLIADSKEKQLTVSENLRQIVQKHFLRVENDGRVSRRLMGVEKRLADLETDGGQRNDPDFSEPPAKPEMISGG